MCLVSLMGRGFPSGQRGGTQDPLAQAFEGSNPSPRTNGQTPENIELFGDYLRDRGFRDSTIKTKVKIVKSLSRKANLWDTKSVEECIRVSECGGRRKNNMGHAYKDWWLWKGFEYKPKWFEEKEQELPYIPTEQELDQLIAGCNSRCVFPATAKRVWL